MYQSAELYEWCDEAGMLVWQEFMFACNPYPVTQEMLDEVRGGGDVCMQPVPGHTGDAG